MESRIYKYCVLKICTPANKEGRRSSFFDHHLKEKDNDYPETLFERFPEVQIIDVSHVKEWATAQDVK